MRITSIRLLSILLLFVGLVTHGVIQSAFPYIPGDQFIVVLLSNTAAFCGAIYLWQSYKAAYPIWLIGYCSALIPVFQLPKSTSVVPDHIWFWLALPVVAGIVVVRNWHQLK
ncbi:MAG: hypothetical protein Q8S26_02220 [Azonexus sp.]|nr:hypothetical protein [Azonexus sp.]